MNKAASLLSPVVCGEAGAKAVDESNKVCVATLKSPIMAIALDFEEFLRNVASHLPGPPLTENAESEEEFMRRRVTKKSVGWPLVQNGLEVT